VEPELWKILIYSQKRRERASPSFIYASSFHLLCSYDSTPQEVQKLPCKIGSHIFSLWPMNKPEMLTPTFGFAFSFMKLNNNNKKDATLRISQTLCW
jgi:hypothetical protein